MLPFDTFPILPFSLGTGLVLSLFSLFLGKVYTEFPFGLFIAVLHGLLVDLGQFLEILLRSLYDRLGLLVAERFFRSFLILLTLFVGSGLVRADVRGRHVVFHLFLTNIIRLLLAINGRVLGLIIGDL